MPRVTGLFQYRYGAEQAVRCVKRLGIDSRDIAIFAYDPASMPSPHPSAETSAVAGAGAGSIFGGVGGALAGLGLVAIPGAGPLVASGWLVTAITGAAAGGATGGAAGGLLGTLLSSGFTEPEEINRELLNGATVVRVSVPDECFHQVSESFQKFAKSNGDQPENGQVADFVCLRSKEER
ncbi:hypothetical protein [Agrobacterium rosae]|uniref:DUF3341 domain-containing protein n=2 Tax=Agrobacterium rosae TaxID=1972867 RepID=A0AAE5RU39_9HYPH|nr:hypothetical protein [Agrobacterium rosae]KAA3509236.1 hypothetical protein DXM21_22750 [Agrobacterium rosae]MQB50956.1 hypothetical protein [Agrobacterium rosae]POO48835.1 hypothetical protein CPJ18_22910 [Agrobacterium rosae]